MKIIAIANRKGGVAKTTTTYNLGAILNRDFQQRVLLVDLDPQASLTSICGVGEVSDDPTSESQGVGLYLAQVFSLAEVLGGAKPGHVDLVDVLVPLGDGLSICPADSALTKTESGLISRLGGEYVLKNVLETVEKDFDLCLIDCAPGQGMLTINALTAADAVIIPSQPTTQDLRALILFIESTRQVKEQFNPHLNILGILLTFYDDRLKHHKQALERIRTLDVDIFPVMIGRSVRVAESAGSRVPLIRFDPHNPQTKNYKALAEIVRARMG